MSTEAPISEAFNLICELAYRHGATPLNQFVDCWEWDVDANWHIALNAQPEPRKSLSGVDVAPFTAYIEWCGGWPAGFINPRGGEFVIGEAANEDVFIEALRKAISEAPPEELEEQP